MTRYKYNKFQLSSIHCSGCTCNNYLPGLQSSRHNFTISLPCGVQLLHRTLFLDYGYYFSTTSRVSPRTINFKLFLSLLVLTLIFFFDTVGNKTHVIFIYYFNYIRNLYMNRVVQNSLVIKIFNLYWYS